MWTRYSPRLGTFVSMTRHLKPLALLWSASALVSGMNFLGMLLIIANVSTDVFAAYTVGLSILMLASTWSDSGLARTLQVLAAQSGNERERLEQYKKIGVRYATRIVPIGFVIVFGLAGALFLQSQIFHAQGGFYLLAAFAVVGVVTARTGFWNALLYASGHFKRSSIVQAMPAVIRVILIGAAIATTELNFGMLMLLTLLPAVLGWSLAQYEWRRSLVTMQCAPIQRSEAETSAEVWKFLKPTMASVIFNSLSYNITLLGASFFASGISIAGYGLFQRFNQIIVVLIGPLNTYIGRQLYMTSPVERRHKGRLYLIVGTSIYMIYGFLAFFGYGLLGQHIQHYGFNFPVEFSVFLLSNLFGYLFVMLDTVMTSTGTADHRFWGTLLYVSAKALLILVLRPDNLLSMVIIDATSILPSIGYYGYWFMCKQAVVSRFEEDVVFH